MELGLDWDRLAGAVRRARGARSQKDIAESGGPSDETISKIERGEWRPSRSVKKTLDKLDIGLGWQPGSSERVLAGGDPVYKMVGVDEFKERMRIKRESMTPEQLAASEVVEQALIDAEKQRSTEDARLRQSKLARVLRARAKPPEERSLEEQILVDASDEERDRLARLSRQAAAERPFIDLVWDGQQLAARKADAEVSSYVRQVESAVVGVVGIDRLAEALDARSGEWMLIQANQAGVLREFMDEVDQLRANGVRDRDINGLMSTKLEELLAAAKGKPGVAQRKDSSDGPENGTPDALAPIVESLRTYLPVGQGDDKASRESVVRGAAELDQVVLGILEDQREMDPSVDFVEDYRRQRQVLEVMIHTPAGQEALLRLAETMIRDSLGKLEVSEVARNYGKFVNVVDDAPPLTQAEVDSARRTARETPLAARDVGHQSEGRRLREEQDRAAEEVDDAQ